MHIVKPMLDQESGPIEGLTSSNIRKKNVPQREYGRCMIAYDKNQEDTNFRSLRLVRLLIINTHDSSHKNEIVHKLTLKSRHRVRFSIAMSEVVKDKNLFSESI